MDLNDVPLFVRVVESGSFTAAARGAQLPKSSVSRSVARLERELGVRLLQRTTRKLALTEAGQAFFERVRGAVLGFEAAESAVRELGGEPRGTVRLTAPPDIYAFGVPEAIAEFVRRHPAIQVELALTARRVDLVAEGFDLAIRAGRLEDSSLVVRRIGLAPLALFAAPSYLKRRGQPRSVAALAQHDCVLFRAQHGRASWRLSGPDGAHGVEVTGPVHVDEMSFALRACVAGAGIALVPLVLARAAVEGGELRHVLPAYSFEDSPLYIVLPSASFVPRRVALLRDALIKRLERELDASRRACADQPRTAARAGARDASSVKTNISKPSSAKVKP